MSKNKEVSFYHLTTSSLLKAAPKLIEKIYYSGLRLIVLPDNPSLLQSIDELLWSYSTKHFIAHGTSNDPYPEDQPILLTMQPNNLNKAQISLAMGSVDLDSMEEVERKLYMFESDSPSQLEYARSKWKNYQDKGIKVNYWRQDDSGNWEQK